MLTNDDFEGEMMRASVLGAEYENTVKECIVIKNPNERKDCVNDAIEEYKIAMTTIAVKQSATIPVQQSVVYDYWPALDLLAVIAMIAFFIALVARKMK